MNRLQEYVQAVRDLVLRGYTRKLLEAGERAEEGTMRVSPGEIIALVVYLIALLVSHLWLPRVSSGMARALIALLPLPPVVLLVISSVRRVLALDELQRRIELVALAVVATSTWLGMFTCWLLQHAGMDLPSLSLVPCAMVALYGFARRWARRHYT